jgi:hypothetical protein
MYLRERPPQLPSKGILKEKKRKRKERKKRYYYI